MTLYQHIQELRAELWNCNEGEEQRRIEAELRTAEREAGALNEAFGAWLEGLD